MNSTSPRPFSPVLGYFAWLALCFAASATAVFVSPGGWYATLLKPTWNPPSWVFGPAWTLLYFMMATAAWLIWREGGWKVQGPALRLFVVQWLLNALWTPLFFGLHQTGLALAEILLLWVMIGLTVKTFWKIKPAAGMLLLPYLGWVTFAAFLNFTLWRMNP